MRRLLIIASAALLLLVAGGVVVWQFALRELKAAVESALGPRASIGAIEVGWSAVEVRELRLRAQAGAWPADDELRAARIRVVPDLGSVWGALVGKGSWRLHRIDVDGAYLSLLRTRDGALRLLPGLLERPVSRDPVAPAVQAPPLRIAALQVRGTVEFFDTSLRRTPHRIQLAAVDARVGPLVLPALDLPAELTVTAAVRSVAARRADGRIELRGQLTPATRDAELQASARGVDLLVLAPYIVRASDVAVKSGTLDLDLRAKVQAQRLQAPGRLVLTGLELGGGGRLGTFAGVPAGLVLDAISRDGRLEVPFSLQGRIDDPSFSMNADFASRLALGLAEKLGVSVSGVVQGIAEGLKGLLRKN